MLGVIGFSAPTEVANVANGELVTIDNSSNAMRDLSSPVLVVRGPDGGRPGKEYRVGNCIDEHGSPVPTAYDRHQCGKGNRIQDQARSDAYSGRLRQLIRDREVCPNRRKKQTRYQCAGSENSQHASDQFHALQNIEEVKTRYIIQVSMDTVSGVLRQVSQDRYAFGMVEAAVSPQIFREYL